MVLGPRRGRFYDAQGEPLETPKEFPGHSVALQLLGTMVLWFGWYGFNPGSALLLTVDHVGRVAATCAVTTSLAAAAGGVCALVTNLYLEERRTGEPSFNLTMCMNGALSGLVAITASCAVVEAWAAVIIGVVAGWLYIYSSALLIRVKIDDAVDAIPVHMVNGAWGLIATGFLASPRLVMEAFGSDHAVGWFYSLGRGSTDASLLANQVCALLFIVGWTFFTMFPFFIWLNYMGWLRSDSLEELVGLDISYHGGGTGSKDGGVKKEYVEAYKRQKSLKSRRSPNYDYGAAARGSHNDPEMNQEAAAQEAFNEED
jgi:ammonium transporter, Amt family